MHRGQACWRRGESMVAATQHSVPRRGALWQAVGYVGLLAAVLLSAGRVRAEPPAREDGLFISIRNPITSDVVDNVKAKTKRALERTDRRIHTFIFDFNPGEQAEGHPSGTKEYGPCHDLAAYLLTLQEVKTVAFVHNEVTAHTVLPVLACTD